MQNLAHYFPYDVKLRLLAHRRSFLGNQKATNAIVGAENVLNAISLFAFTKHCRTFLIRNVYFILCKLAFRNFWSVGKLSKFCLQLQGFKCNKVSIYMFL